MQNKLFKSDYKFIYSMKNSYLSLIYYNDNI